MLNLIKENKIILGIVLVVIVGFVWYGMSDTTSTGSILSTSAGATAVQAAGGDKELIASLLQLKSIKLDGAIFNDPVFLSLQDNTTNIVAEPIGRANPFAPLPGLDANGATSTFDFAEQGAGSPQAPSSNNLRRTR